MPLILKTKSTRSKKPTNQTLEFARELKKPVNSKLTPYKVTYTVGSLRTGNSSNSLHTTFALKYTSDRIIFIESGETFRFIKGSNTFISDDKSRTEITLTAWEEVSLTLEEE